jgi:hypothetical protein
LCKLNDTYLVHQRFIIQVKVDKGNTVKKYSKIFFKFYDFKRSI